MIAALLLAACVAEPVEAATPPLSVEGDALCLVDGIVVADGPVAATLYGDLWLLSADGWSMYVPRESCAIEVQ